MEKAATASAHLLLGIDVGTSGTKVLLVDAHDGNAIAHTTIEYPLSMPKPNWCEQNPHDWWNAAVQGIRSVLNKAQVSADDIAAVGLSGQMHGLVALDRNGEVIRPAILWNDQRTGRQCAALTALIGPVEIIARTGNVMLPGFTLPKILWMRDEEPDHYAKVAHVLLPKDYVRARLTKRFDAIDEADASGTGLFDVAHRCWSGAMVDDAGIQPEWLPTVHQCADVVGEITREAADMTGLIAGTPVVAGAGDQAAQAIGSGILREGEVSVTIGTSGVVFAPVASYRADDQRGSVHAFCHAVPGMWHLMGVMLCAGASLRWFRDTLCQTENEHACHIGKDPYDLLAEEAATIEPGCEGLTFLPYLTGERTPHINPDARGAFVGLSLRHTHAHLSRAVFEGITFGLRDSFDLLKNMGVKNPEWVRISGGGAKSPFWRQLLADVLGVRVIPDASIHGAAMGAAVIAGIGTRTIRPDRANPYDPWPERQSQSESNGLQASEPRNSHELEEAYERYRALYPSLQRWFNIESNSTGPPTRH